MLQERPTLMIPPFVTGRDERQPEVDSQPGLVIIVRWKEGAILGRLVETHVTFPKPASLLLNLDDKDSSTRDPWARNRVR